ncbi:hypothetical protein Dimus_019657 [Dionaea muscipula]
MQEDQDSGRRLRWRPGDRKPHFFKIIVSADQQNQLRIPPEFVRNHGRDLSNWARLTVPHTGIVLEVELVKSGDQLWLRRGWDKFMKGFSIGYGYFLVFRYEGNSRFHVIIFDLSATEVEYPLMAAGNWDQLIQSEPKEVTKAEKVDHINGHGKGCLLTDGDDDDDLSLEILDHSPIGTSTPNMCVVDMTGEGAEEDDSMEILENSSSRLGKMDAPAPDHLPGEERRIWNMTKTKTMKSIPMGHGKKYLAVEGDRAITLHAVGSRKKWRARYRVDYNAQAQAQGSEYPTIDGDELRRPKYQTSHSLSPRPPLPSQPRTPKAPTTGNVDTVGCRRPLSLSSSAVILPSPISSSTLRHP